MSDFPAFDPNQKYGKEDTEMASSPPQIDIGQIDKIHVNIDTYVDQMIYTLHHINDCHLPQFRDEQIDLQNQMIQAGMPSNISMDPNVQLSNHT